MRHPVPLLALFVILGCRTTGTEPHTGDTGVSTPPVELPPIQWIVGQSEYCDLPSYCSGGLCAEFPGPVGEPRVGWVHADGHLHVRGEGPFGPFSLVFDGAAWLEDPVDPDLNLSKLLVAGDEAWSIRDSRLVHASGDGPFEDVADAPYPVGFVMGSGPDNLWVANWNDGASSQSSEWTRWDGSSWVSLGDGPEYPRQGVAVGSNRAFYQYSGGIASWDGASWVLTTPTAGILHAAPDGVVWLSADDALYRESGGVFTLEVPTGGRIAAVDAEGAVWVATPEGRLGRWLDGAWASLPYEIPAELGSLVAQGSAVWLLGQGPQRADAAGVCGGPAQVWVSSARVGSSVPPAVTFERAEDVFVEEPVPGVVSSRTGTLSVAVPTDSGWSVWDFDSRDVFLVTPVERATVPSVVAVFDGTVGLTGILELQDGAWVQVAGVRDIALLSAWKVGDMWWGLGTADFERTPADRLVQLSPDGAVEIFPAGFEIDAYSVSASGVHWAASYDGEDTTLHSSIDARTWTSHATLPGELDGLDVFDEEVWVWGSQGVRFGDGSTMMTLGCSPFDWAVDVSPDADGAWLARTSSGEMGGFFAGLSRFDRATGQQWLDGPSARAVSRTADGELWVTTQSSGLWRGEPEYELDETCPSSF